MAKVIKGKSKQWKRWIKKHKKHARTIRQAKHSKKEKTVINHKTFKFLGYCKCGSLISSGDLEQKNTYICPNCGKKGKIKELKKEKKNVDRPVTKKEYLDSTINAEHLDAPYVGHEDIPPEILKKFEEDD